MQIVWWTMKVWKVITKMHNAGEYINCVDSWIDFVLKCFAHRELNTVLGDIIKVCTGNTIKVYTGNIKVCTGDIIKVCTGNIIKVYTGVE